MDYGPVQPLSDPEEHAKLAELLKGGGLVPVDVDLYPYTHAPIQLEVTPPTSDWYSIEGITSRMHPGEIRLRNIEVQGRRVLPDTDAAAFNLGHLVPMPLGCFSRFNPVTILSQVDNRMVQIPRLLLTLWCRISPPAWGLPFDRDSPYAPIGAGGRAAPSPALLKALRLLKEGGHDVEDDELRALLDHYAQVL